MKATILIIELLSNANLGSTGNLLFQLVATLVLLGVPLSLAALLLSLRNAPEGYEDEKGFHFTQSRPSISHSSGVAILHLQHAG
jgi:hypothetical protein